MKLPPLNEDSAARRILALVPIHARTEAARALRLIQLTNWTIGYAHGRNAAENAPCAPKA